MQLFFFGKTSVPKWKEQWLLCEHHTCRAVSRSARTARSSCCNTQNKKKERPYWSPLEWLTTRACKETSMYRQVLERNEHRKLTTSAWAPGTHNQGVVVYLQLDPCTQPSQYASVYTSTRRHHSECAMQHALSHQGWGQLLFSRLIRRSISCWCIGFQLWQHIENRQVIPSYLVSTTTPHGRRYSNKAHACFHWRGNPSLQSDTASTVAFGNRLSLIRGQVLRIWHQWPNDRALSQHTRGREDLGLNSIFEPLLAQFHSRLLSSRNIVPWSYMQSK